MSSRERPAAGTAPTVVRSRKSQRLRAVATVLALTAVMLLISAVGVVAAVLRASGSDRTAQDNLLKALRAAEQIDRNSSFANLTPGALHTQVPSLQITANPDDPSVGPMQVSMMVDSEGNGWYGAVRSSSGRCFAAATINGDPRVLTTVLSMNCTGDAARGALMPLKSPDVMTSAVTTPNSLPSSDTSG